MSDQPELPEPPLPLGTDQPDIEPPIEPVPPAPPDNGVPNFDRIGPYEQPPRWDPPRQYGDWAG